MPLDDGFQRGQPISIQRLEDTIRSLQDKRLMAHKQASAIEGSIQAYQHILDELIEHQARQEQPKPGATNEQENKDGTPARHRNGIAITPAGDAG